MVAILSPISIDSIERYARKWLMVYNVSIRNTKNTYVERIVADGDSLQYFNVDGTHKWVWSDVITVYRE